MIVSKVEGPVFFAELGQPDSFIGSWSHAEATVTGPQPTPDGLSIELANFKLDRVANNGAKPLASAEQVAFRARLDPIATAATKKAAYDLTSDIAAGSLPMGPPMAARPFEARVKAVLHGVGDMTSKPLPARLPGGPRRRRAHDLCVDQPWPSRWSGAELYHARMAQTQGSGGDDERRRQRDWIGARKQCLASSSCLEKIYKQRIAELGGQAPEATAQPSQAQPPPIQQASEQKPQPQAESLP